jgi:hypothetical protein
LAEPPRCSLPDSASSQATLIDNGTFTTDDVSGLDWLDMSFTDGLSYNQVDLALGAGGTLAGWRFATTAEFDALIFQAVGGSPVDYLHPSQFTQMVNLINLMEPTYADLDFAFAVGYVDSTGLTVADARQFGYDEPDGYYRPASDNTWDAPFNTASALAGAFLVRSSLPEPSTALLMLVGLGVAVTVRERV